MKFWKKPIWKGIACSLLVSILFTACYGVFRDGSKKYMSDSTSTEGNIAWLYESSYILYKDLYHAVNGNVADYRDIYLDVKDGYELLLGEDNLNPENIQGSVAEDLIGDLERFEQYYSNLEDSFDNLNRIYGYMIEDTVSGKAITNLSAIDLETAKNYYFQLSFVFDDMGNVSVGEYIISPDAEQIRRLANGKIRQYSSQNPVVGELSVLNQYASVTKPVNCTVTFYITMESWKDLTFRYDVMEAGNGFFAINRYVDTSLRYAYNQAGAGSLLTVLFLLTLLLGFVLSKKKEGYPPGRNMTLISSPEFLVLAGLFWYVFLGNNITRWVPYVAEGDAEKNWGYALSMLTHTEILVLIYFVNTLILVTFFLGAWYIGFYVSECKTNGFGQYLRKHSLIYQIFPFTKRKCREAYEKVANFDLTRNSNKMIVRLLLINGVILLVISSLWVAGWAVVVIYSLIMYVVLRKYVSDLQKRYGILLRATNEIAKGNLNVEIQENLGVFEPFKPEITKIQTGFKNAVEQEVKSQRMKSELITNVSHDLKTPLTAIITYISLLKEKNITEEQRTEYLDTLERKSLRLKVLIEDLFEVSKATSNNVTLNIMDVDIMNLVKQVSFEMSDKLQASNLDVRLNLPEGRITLPLDSQKTYRVYENLFGNVAKYAMPGTRVYVSGALRDGCVEIILKNITAQEITVESNELTERFVRNDTSRNTEGSGLGLAIAKSFMELQGGSLKIDVDGDLFKATTIWPLKELPK